MSLEGNFLLGSSKKLSGLLTQTVLWEITCYYDFELQYSENYNCVAVKILQYTHADTRF